MRKRKLKKRISMDFSMCIIYGDDPGEYAGEGTKNREIVLFNANVTSGGSVTGGGSYDRAYG